MKVNSHISLLLALTILMLTACERDNFDETILDDPIYTPPTETYNDLVNQLRVRDNNAILLGCVALDMPLSFVLVSGDTLSVKNQAEAEAALDLVDDEAIQDFVFPIVADNQFTRFIVIDDNKTLADYYVNCVPAAGWTDAESNDGAHMPAFLMEEYNIEISYPVTLTNGTETLVADDDEALTIHKVENPALAFVFPFEIFANGAGPVMISDMESFFNTVFENTNVVPPYVDGNIPVNGFGCNEMQFPIEVKIEDEQEITLTNKDEYALQILTGDYMELQYPFELNNNNTGLNVVNELGDLLTLQDQCGYTNDPIYTCTYAPHVLLFFNIAPNECYYIINYPVEIKINGVSQAVNSSAEYNTLMQNVDPADVELVYPISVEVNFTTRTYYSDADVCMYSKECE